jgi:diguanylate cyclase (GGDEF)-like protein
MEQTAKRAKTLPLRQFNATIILFITVLGMLLFWSTIRLSQHYKQLITATQQYVACTQEASQLNAASIYLTTQTRMYVAQRDRRYMDAYFDYMEEEGGRLGALEALRAYDDTENLQNVISSVQVMITIEHYAMRLVADAIGNSEDSLPEAVRNVQLTDSDAALSRRSKLDRAAQLLSDTTYEQANMVVLDYSTLVIEPLLEEMELHQHSSVLALSGTLLGASILLFVLIAANGAIFAVLTRLVVQPLNQAVEALHSGAPIQEIGVSELRYLAHTYNEVHELACQTEDLLRHRAEIDPVTGIPNRNAFQKASEFMQSEAASVTLLIVDVDHFKQINDAYGHGMGDAALRRVATALTNRFRVSDCVARIGGDEFAVLLRGTGAENGDAIRQKAEALNRDLTAPQDGLPALSLSIGVAFSSHGYSRDLFNRADRALYTVKQNGRCGCAFDPTEAAPLPCDAV